MDANKKNASIYSDFDKVINVGIADIKYASSPSHLRTNLGSCVALILYDKVQQIGGLVHIMLPKSFKDEVKVGKCADTAVPEIINTMINKKKCERKNLVVKMFGGAKMLANTTMDIGNQNIVEVTRLVKEHNLKISVVKSGGTKGYVVQIDTATGLVMCRVFGDKIEYV
ncbi:chemotaxis protein CheD [Thermodesulfobacteriota bacterium]